MKIAVAGTGYVGLSVALLLSQHNKVHALDIIPEKVELLNSGKSPIVDPVITDFLEKNTSGERPLDFHATIDAQEAYTDADFAVIATPTNYDEKKNYFDTSSVEAAIAAVRQHSPHAWIVIKSTIPVGYTQQLRENLDDDRILFSPNSCAKAMLCTTICIQAALSSELRKMMPNPSKPRTSLHLCSPKALIQARSSAPIMTAAPASLLWWSAPPKPKPSNYSPTRIWRFAWRISTN